MNRLFMKTFKYLFLICSLIIVSFNSFAQDTMEQPVNLGSKSYSFEFVDTKNTTNFSDDYTSDESNDYSGQESNDVFYKFILTNPMEVVISHCGSDLNDTYLHILNESGSEIASCDDNYETGSCTNHLNSYIKLPTLPAGTYYVISEGYGDNNGNITTSIIGKKALPATGLYDGSAVQSSGNISTNYLYTITPTVATSDVSGLGVNESLQSIQYFDGLGRPIQTVQRGITPAKSDLVTFTEYDGVGREYKQWLPVQIVNNNGAFVPFSAFEPTAKSQVLYDNDIRPFNEIKYEPSPLNRVEKQFGSGQAWVDHPVNMQHGTNDGNIAFYFVNSSNNLEKGLNYAENALYKTQITDEDGKRTVEYKDKIGQVVLKQNFDDTGADVNTYYVYNDLGQLSYVIPPLAADDFKILSANTVINDDNDNLKKYCYLYKYDEHGNCTYKRLPGCFPIFMLYDKANRLIIYQDGNQRSSTPVSWTVNKYDGLGRLVFTALLYRDISQSEKDMIHSNIITGPDDETNAINFNGTTTTLFQNELIFLTLNYYDNYSFLDRLTTAEKTNLNYVSPGSADYGNRYADSNGNVNAKGLLTGTRVYILDNVISSYLATAIYYDERGQLVQSRSTNHLSGYDFTYNGYNFAGQILKTKHTHSSATRPAIDEITTNIYDNAGRLKTVKYKIGGYTDDVILSSYTYDELGRVVGNMRHNSTDSELFEYNIRNWSTKITSGTFVEKILYNKDLPSQATARYNGNIAFSSVISGGGRALGYTYTYDNLNRLRLSTGYSVSPSTGALTAYGYNEEFNYDKQGNINFLQRKTSTTLMDYLGFTYNGNQITAIYDYTGSINVYDIKEYNNNNTSGYDFAYDNNGNMLVDKDRKIVAIRYNLLNLPDIIQFSNGNQIKNRYAADGRKLGTEYYTQLTQLSQPLTEGTILNQTYQANVVDQKGNAYIGNFEYSTIWNVPLYTTLRKVFNSEGYVDEFNNNQTYSGFVYYRQDHLGNNCEVWRAGKAGGTAAATLQRTRYYPSGLPWNYTTGYAPTTQQYKYNGKEFIEMHGLDEYDSEARHYYPTIGRTTTIDPLAEKYYSISPYAWCAGNPVNNIDPQGMAVWSTTDPETIKRAYNDLVNGRDVTYNDNTWNYKSDEQFLNKGEDEGFGIGLNYSDKTKHFYLGTKLSIGGIAIKDLGEANLISDPDSQYGIDGSYNLYTKNETDAAMEFYLCIAGGELIGAALEGVSLISWVSRLNVTKEGVKIIAANGTKIEGFVAHAVNRAIQRGVSPASILDALKNPLKIGEVVIDNMGRASQRLIGRSAEVVINPETGRIITVNPTSSAKAMKLLKQLGQ